MRNASAFERGRWLAVVALGDASSLQQESAHMVDGEKFLRIAVHVAGAVALFFAVVGLSAGPSFTCHRIGTAKATRVVCDAVSVGDIVPEWRLFGSHSDELMFFDEGPRVTFDPPAEWRLLEMRIEKRRFRAWVRVYRNAVEWKRYGDEGK